MVLKAKSVPNNTSFDDGFQRLLALNRKIERAHVRFTAKDRDGALKRMAEQADAWRLEYRGLFLEVLQIADTCEACLRLWGLAPDDMERAARLQAREFLSVATPEEEVRLYNLMPHSERFLLSAEALILYDTWRRSRSPEEDEPELEELEEDV